MVLPVSVFKVGKSYSVLSFTNIVEEFFSEAVA